MTENRAGGVERFLLVLLTGLTLFSLVLLLAQALTPQSWQIAGLTIDRLSATIALLVSGVGAVVYRFALRYLDGEPRQRQFLHWLCGTVFVAYILILATNLLVLFAAWLLTSIGLHWLLTYYDNRAAAHPPARKKFLISRMGDVALLAAIGLIWQQWGTLDLLTFLERLNSPASWGLASDAVAFLIVIAALTKSAQFPFHSWLPETMEAPTPVSALMHAGIINAGGVMLLKFAPLLVQAPLVLLLLTAVGAFTAALGLLAMWAQTTIKRGLAWSTVSQMGFMMVQIGLAAFPAAILHLVGHGSYKAWAFLRSGGLPLAAPASQKLPAAQALGIGLAGTLVGIPALWWAAGMTGFDPLHSAGELALTAVLALAIGQLWVSCFQARRVGASPLPSLSAAILLTPLTALLACALYKGAADFYAPVLGGAVAPTGPLAWTAAILAPLVMALLAAFYTLLPALGTTQAGRALYVHALHGFYIGALADRLVARLWSTSAPAAAQRG